MTLIMQFIWKVICTPILYEGFNRIIVVSSLVATYLKIVWLLRGGLSWRFEIPNSFAHFQVLICPSVSSPITFTKLTEGWTGLTMPSILGTISAREVKCSPLWIYQGQTWSSRTWDKFPFKIMHLRLLLSAWPIRGILSWLMFAILQIGCLESLAASSMILTYSINYIFIGKAFNVNRYVYVHMQMNTSPRFTLYLKDMYWFRGL